MSEWKYGKEVMTRMYRQMLRDQDFPSSDECPMPAEHKERKNVRLHEKGERVYLCESETEWIAGIPWEDL